jgi:hypothetical protein
MNAKPSIGVAWSMLLFFPRPRSSQAVVALTISPLLEGELEMKTGFDFQLARRNHLTFEQFEQRIATAADFVSQEVEDLI